MAILIKTMDPLEENNRMKANLQKTIGRYLEKDTEAANSRGDIDPLLTRY